MSSLLPAAQDWLIKHHMAEQFSLEYVENCLTLFKRDEPKLGGVCVDFVTGAMAHRRRFGGGRGEAVAKAIGIKGDYLPTVIDATAGLGRDAFVLASLGCKVTMFERHPVVAALLQDGLARAYQDIEIGEQLKQHLTLIHDNSFAALASFSQTVDVVYLDPMFPHRQKTALVKKEMRVFQSLVGSDDDADQLLDIARRVAKKRIVVKRPDYAGFLAEQPTTSSVKTKNHRFDIYPPIQ